MPRLRTYKYVLTHYCAGDRKIMLNAIGEPVTFDNPERGQEYIRSVETHPLSSFAPKYMRIERAHKWRAEIAAAMIRGQ